MSRRVYTDNVTKCVSTVYMSLSLYLGNAIWRTLWVYTAFVYDKSIV